uniref:Uncharacterized protein n=1 Tax=Zea mays TaxID=4577 RepID=C4J1U5_MAIZE|nr:unknown [Zea mays]
MLDGKHAHLSENCCLELFQPLCDLHGPLLYRLRGAVLGGGDGRGGGGGGGGHVGDRPERRAERAAEQ